MGPLLLATAGLVALGVAGAILRSFGPRYRVGRLLAVAPKVPIAEARRIAQAGEQRYVRIDGRIDSDAEFEDQDHRPLVVRRTRLEWRPAGSRGAWTTFDSTTEAVAFVVREGLDEIEVDGDRLAEGLIVVPRESTGRVEDLGDRAPAEIARDAEARLVIEHVSSVEHATVLGVPTSSSEGRLAMAPGMGRPLILTTLESNEAMRVLTGGATDRSRLAIACLVAAGLLITVALAWWLVDAVTGGVAVAFAASPDPSQRPGGDTRSSGQAPGFVGEPVLAVLAMLGIGVLSVLASLAYVRLTGGRREPVGGPDDRTPRPR